MRFGRLTVRAGFILLITVLVWLDQGGLLWVVFGAAILHELGHYIPLRLFGGQVASLELTGGGIGMERDAGFTMSYGRDLITVLAGPAVSILFALLFSLRDGIIEQQAALAGMCFSHGIFNLLPMRGLDGGNALALALGAAGYHNSDAVLRTATVITAALLSVLCGYMAWRYRNISLLLAMLYVLTSVRSSRRSRGQ